MACKWDTFTISLSSLSVLTLLAYKNISVNYSRWEGHIFAFNNILNFFVACQINTSDEMHTFKYSVFKVVMRFIKINRPCILWDAFHTMSKFSSSYINCDRDLQHV